jgi:hypothetical protein
MEIILVILALAVVGVIWFVNRDTGADVNDDGKVDVQDVKAAVKKTVAAVKAAADITGDGKVDTKDVKAAVTKTKTAVRKTATKAKTTVKKAVTKTASKRGPKPKTGA